MSKNMKKVFQKGLMIDGPSFTVRDLIQHLLTQDMESEVFVSLCPKKVKQPNGLTPPVLDFASKGVCVYLRTWKDVSGRKVS